METLMCVASGLALACCAWLLLAPGGTRPASPSVSRLRGEALAAAREFGSLPQLAALERAGVTRRAVDELVRDDRLLRVGAGREVARSVVVGFVVACGLAGLVVSLSPAGLLVGAIAGIVAIPVWCETRERRRRQELARQVPDVFRSLAGALASGRTLSQAISYVGSLGTGALHREFARASLAVSCGESATGAVEQVAARTKAPGVDLMVCALAVSARTGAPLQGLFLRSAKLVERRFELERELSSKTAQVRLSSRIVSGLPVCLVGALTLVSPDFRAGVATPMGLGCVVVAACLDIVALVLIRRLMRSVL